MNYLIIDTETTNDISQPIPYDISYVICDETGTILTDKAFCVAEIFCDMPDLLETAYYADKIPQYRKEIRKGVRQLRTIRNIRKEIARDIKKYNITEIGAYNMAFDKRSCNNSIRYLSQSFFRWFFPSNVNFFCIWNYACNTIFDEEFIRWAITNDLVSNCGNVLTNAEVAYKYLTKDMDFKEEHKGNEDAKIEAYIFSKCFEYDSTADRSVSYNCWQKVQKLRKTLDFN